MKIDTKVKKSIFFLVAFVIISLVNAADLTDIGDLIFEGQIYINNVRGGIFPQGMIAIFDGSCPSGWTEQTGYQGKFIRGESVANKGSTGGSDSHTHTVSGTSGSESSHTHGAGTYAGPSHTHGVGSLTFSHTHSYDTPGDTSSGADMGADAGSTASDVCTFGHTHYANPGPVTSGGHNGLSWTGSTGSGGTGSVTGTSGTGSSHSHGVGTLSGDSASTLPPYKNVVLCSRN